ncbi:hypothetical protein ACWGB8_26440 [Kitasatospora sp. NPDC054939]
MFALELRALLDPVDVPIVSGDTGVSPAAIYAALSGTRVCSDRTLSALLRAHFTGLHQTPLPAKDPWPWVWTAFATVHQFELIDRLSQRRQIIESSSRSVPRGPAVSIGLPQDHRRFVQILRRHLPNAEEDLLKLSTLLSRDRSSDEDSTVDSVMPGGPKAGERNITLKRLQGFLRGSRIPNERTLSRIIHALPDLTDDSNRVLELRDTAKRARAARARARHAAHRQAPERAKDRAERPGRRNRRAGRRRDG